MAAFTKSSAWGQGNELTSAIHLYVAPNATGASDKNAGGDPSLPLASLDEAIRRVNKMRFIGVLTVVHLASGTYTWTEKITPKVLEKQLVIIGDGAGQDGDDGFTELLADTAQAGTGATTVVTSGGLGVDAFQGKTLEMVDGAAAGFRRTLQGNDATNLTPQESFVTAPGVGDALRVLEPAVVIALPAQTEADDAYANMANVPGLTGVGTADGGGTGPFTIAGSSGRASLGLGTRSYVGLVNLAFIGEDQAGSQRTLSLLSSTCVMQGVELRSTAGADDEPRFAMNKHTTLLCGLDQYSVGPLSQLGVDLGLATDLNAWGGWGLAYQNAGGDGIIFGLGAIRGTMVISGGSTFFVDADLSLRGRFSNTTFASCRGVIKGAENSSPDTIFDSDASRGVAVVAGSKMRWEDFVINQDGGNAALTVAGGQTPNIFGELLSFLALDDGTFVGTNNPVNAVVVTGGSQVRFDEGSQSASGFSGDDCAVRNGAALGNLIDSADFVALTAGVTIPAAITSDGRDGWIGGL